MTPARVVDVTAVLDEGRLGRFHAGAYAVLGACLVVDGFDVQAMGYVAPAVIREFGVPMAALGPVFGAGLFGLFLGSLLSGMAADRVGRRPVLLAATAAFGLFTLLGARATSLPELAVLRFLAGLGLGAIMPNATALVGEYSPRRQRIAAMMIVTNGFMVGAVLGGFLSAWLVPAHGWRTVLRVGGLVPLALLLPMAAWLPESVQLLAVRGARPDRIARCLARIRPGLPEGPDVRYVAREERREGIPVLHLFREGRAPGTALLWVLNFMNVLDAFFVASWLPTLVQHAGHPTRTAVLVGTTVQVGGALGTVALGLILRRGAFVPVLATCFAGAALGLAALGTPGLPIPALAAVAFLVGWGVFGGQPGVNALAATWYPTDLRSTGIGAGLGIGRLGAVLGPLLAGALLQRDWSTQALFLAAALPAVLSTAATLSLRAVLGPARRPAGGAVAPP